ncbi:protein canopy homolog 2 [Manacus vitellinus]|uniref:protein canopy homolog 2 n=1 Tax=Manacus vitellinus TaxID=328815 RepID=UPI00115DEACC|nr:protein canopy homolog 2 [Manacus vitellinus]
MKEYGEKTDQATHRKSYVRVISHDGTKMNLSGVKFDGDVTSSLKFACESIAEEYEDELIEFLSHEAENVKDRLCSKRTGEPGEPLLFWGSWLLCQGWDRRSCRFFPKSQC